MKALLSFVFACSGIHLAAGQGTLVTSGPSFSTSDTLTAEVISLASMQSYPVGLDRQSIWQEEPKSVQVIEKEGIADAGPIRDWSNPPGYLGYSNKDIALSKRKPIDAKKYQRMKRYRCYTF